MPTVTVPLITATASVRKQFLPGVVIQPQPGKVVASVDEPLFTPKLWGITVTNLAMTPTRKGSGSISLIQNSTLEVESNTTSQAAVTLSSVSTIKIKPLLPVHSLFS